MGGSGGSYFPSNPSQLRGYVEKSKQEQVQKCLDSDVNKYLQDLLKDYNERDTEKIQEYIQDIKAVLGEDVDVENFLFGGSVAKHTYVDGLSDIDALVVLDRKELHGKSPQYVLNKLFNIIHDNLKIVKLKSVEKGNLSVTVNYKDGTQIQLLPALKSGSNLAIKSTRGNEWNITNPKVFQKKLTKANERLNGLLIPTIKLAKSINSGLPKPKQLESYHIESLALESIKNYRGPATPKALLQHFYNEAQKRVLQPIQDVTGQSRTVDSYLGKGNSIERKIASVSLASISRKLNLATSVDPWKGMFED